MNIILNISGGVLMCASEIIDRMINNFTQENLSLLIRSKINSFKSSVESLDYHFQNRDSIGNNFGNITILGQAKLNQSEDLLVISACSNNDLNERSGKKVQFEIAKEIIKTRFSDSAIFVFYDKHGSFRFSFIRVNYKGAKRDFSDFKRFTYYINKNNTNKTFIKQIGQARFSSLDAIQDAFSVEPLTKDFYSKLQNWYFWAIQNVQFPSQPNEKTLFNASTKINKDLLDKALDEAIKEHKAQNVIRLLTRILFVWFIKQKGLIPEELFDLEILKEKFLPDLHTDSELLFAEADTSSIYYKAILQNLFFASLNCPKETSNLDNRTRGFRKPGQHQGIDHLMRYETSFKNSEDFLALINQSVPFLNGGLFECLDNKDTKRYIDGFSDNLPKNHNLIVPDFLFFGYNDNVNLSQDYGNKNRKYSNLKVEGLIKLLKSYNFTVDENEANDIEVALDPELLGKVFENLLASFNPETKTTARKQTGSFYTPREIVNYMVEESLIAHLKNSISWDSSDQDLDNNLKTLVSTSTDNPFKDKPKITQKIIKSLDECKILDPACGSGAFPMGILQKMVHILRKIDPSNKNWQDLQIDKAKDESNKAFEINDQQERDAYLKDISDIFDMTINSPDYARKLFLVENCIYGVDIQPIATQISKLRFFISLVVEQNVCPNKENFGIKPLPNLETKFVTANTLIGINKLDENFSIAETKAITKLKNELKLIRHKLFNARTKATKLKYRNQDKELRDKISLELMNSGWMENDAKLLANWDPYDQNASSPFFNPEWMFGINQGFDIVIGNPPYVSVKNILPEDKLNYAKSFKTCKGRFNLFNLFIENGFNILKPDGNLIFIIPEAIYSNIHYSPIREFLIKNTKLNKLCLFSSRIFEAAVDTTILNFTKNKPVEVGNISVDWNTKKVNYSIKQFELLRYPYFIIPAKMNEMSSRIINNLLLYRDNEMIGNKLEIQQGIIYSGQEKQDIFSNEILDSTYKKCLDGRDIESWLIKWDQKVENKFISYTDQLHRKRDEKLFISEEKILIPRKSTSLICAIDRNKFYALNTAYICLKIEYEDEIEFYASLINSKIINFIYKYLFFGWQVTIPALKLLPVPKTIKADQVMIKLLVEIITFVKSNNTPIETFSIILDSLIFNLYFPDHMKERGIEVIDLVDSDLKKVLGEKEFDNLEESEKLAVVEELNKMWSDPANEVVKRIKSFKEKSPDILKVILES
jgi:hypothetical protein